jgi:hypothetical protein
LETEAGREPKTEKPVAEMKIEKTPKWCFRNAGRTILATIPIYSDTGTVQGMANISKKTAKRLVKELKKALKK